MWDSVISSSYLYSPEGGRVSVTAWKTKHGRLKGGSVKVREKDHKNK